MNRTAIIQARMSSSRLPGKVMRKIGGKPMLRHVIERAQQVNGINEVWVATTTAESDDPIEDYCQQIETLCFRGDMHDVLDRYYQVACLVKSEMIVRLTADCPLIDPGLVEETIAAMDGVDFSANRLPPPWTRSFPIGLDSEVCSFGALERAWKEARQSYHREHVLTYIYEGVEFEETDDQPGAGQSFIRRGKSTHGFHIAQLHHHPDLGKLRWTVDTAEDLELVNQIFIRMADKPGFTWLDLIELFSNNPELALINASVTHKTAYDVDARMSQ